MNNDEPLISIVLPVYNGEKYLSAAIDSCLHQTYRHIELIIVDDCSTDASSKIMHAYADMDTRIKIKKNTVNKKLPGSLNIGHKIASGDYITWTSDDNMYRPDAIQTLYDHLIKNDVDLTYSAFNTIDANGHFKREVRQSENKHLLLGNTIGACFMYKKAVFEHVNGYNEALHTVEDYDFWLRAFKNHRFYYIDDILYDYRLHENSLTATLEKENSPAVTFDDKLQIVYHHFFKTYQDVIPEDFPSLFYKLSRNEAIDVKHYLKKYRSFKNVLHTLDEYIPSLEIEKLISCLDKKVRHNFLSHNAHQNIPTLIRIIRHRPRLLFGYERRRSMRYIIKSITKRSV